MEPVCVSRERLRRAAVEVLNYELGTIAAEAAAVALPGRGLNWRSRSSRLVVQRSGLSSWEGAAGKSWESVGQFRTEETCRSDWSR